jgi:hypothetical protein
VKANNDNTIVFESLDEVSNLKNYLISYIKKNKRLIRDRGEEPILIINLNNIENGKSDERKT